MDRGPALVSDELLCVSKVLRPCLGPMCKQYLLVTRTLNKVVVTGSGLSVLKHALKADAAVAGKPLVRIAMASVNAHERAFGDGSTSLMLMIAEGLREAKKVTGGRAPQKLALSRDLSRVRSTWLHQVIVPHLVSQSLGVGDSPGGLKTARLEHGLNLGVYLERMRSVLQTVLAGLFAAQSCHLVVELVVNWIATTAKQMHHRPAALRRSLGCRFGGNDGRSSKGKTKLHDGRWDESRRCLVAAARFIRRHKETLLLKATGAGLSESRIVDDGVILPYPLIGAHPKKPDRPHLRDGAHLRFVVFKCPVEPSSCSPVDGDNARVRVDVATARQHGELLRNRGRTMKLVVDALKVAKIDLIVCTHALKDPFPSLLQQANIAGLQLVETHDADYLAQRFSARPFHCVRGNNAFLDGTEGSVGLARGVRQLCLGQRVQSSFCFVYGSCHRFSTAAEGSALNGGAAALEGGVEGPPGLACQVVLRAPGDGMLIEYVSCVSRCLLTMLAWLEWDPPSGSTVACPTAPDAPASFGSCMVAPGGGASETSLHLLFRDLALHHPTLGGNEGHPSCSGDGAGREDTDCPRSEGGSPSISQPKNGDKFPDDDQPTAIEGVGVREGIRRGPGDTPVCNVKAAWEAVGGEGGSDHGVRLAFSVLAAALAVIPRVLLQNASAVSHPSKPSHSERQGRAKSQLSSLARLERTLKCSHANHGRSSTALVFRPARDTTGLAADDSFSLGAATQGREAVVSLSCALEAGVVHPLAVKYGMLVALLDALISSLRVGEVVNCRGRLEQLRVAGGDGERCYSSDEDE